MATEASAGIVIWLTGMSGAGKSTIAKALVRYLRAQDIKSTLLDGDDLRAGLNSDLGFSAEERTENLRRVAHVAALFRNEGFVTVTATISPEPVHRENARQIVGQEAFVEVFVDTPLPICEMRDPKGLYKQARRGEVKQFTGVGAPYHPPVQPDVTLHTQVYGVEECVEQIVDYLVRTRRFNPKSTPAA